MHPIQLPLLLLHETLLLQLSLLLKKTLQIDFFILDIPFYVVTLFYDRYSHNTILCKNVLNSIFFYVTNQLQKFSITNFFVRSQKKIYLQILAHFYSQYLLSKLIR